MIHGYEKAFFFLTFTPASPKSHQEAKRDTVHGYVYSSMQKIVHYRGVNWHIHQNNNKKRKSYRRMTRFASPTAGLEAVIGGGSHHESHSGTEKLFSAETVVDNVV